MKREIVAIDFETANHSQASICALGVSHITKRGKVESIYYTLIHPHDDVSYFDPFNIYIHGIEPEDVEDAPYFYEIYDELMEMFEGNIIIAHNAPFDMGCLRAACEMDGLEVPPLQYLDTVRLARKVWPDLPNHRLNTVADYLDIELDHHEAESDAFACAWILRKIMEECDEKDIDKLLDILGYSYKTLKCKK